MPVYKIEKPIDRFLDIWSELGVTTFDAKRQRYQIDTQSLAARGLNADLLLAIQKNDRRQKVISPDEQQTFIDFYARVARGPLPEQRVAEFHRLTDAATSPWYNHPYFLEFFTKVNSAEAERIQFFLLQRCIDALQPSASVVSVTMLSAGNQEIPSYLMPLVGQLADPVEYSVCPADEARVDLQKDLAVNSRLLPQDLSVPALATLVVVVIKNTQQTGSGCFVYLGNGYYTSARHVLYPDGNDGRDGSRIADAFAIATLNDLVLSKGQKYFYVKGSGITIVQEDTKADFVVFRIDNATSLLAPPKLQSLPANPQSWVGKTVIHVGAPAFASAYPGEKLATYGKILAVDAERGIIVVDCPTAPGSSGGSLMLEDGTVIGIARQTGLVAESEALPLKDGSVAYRTDIVLDSSVGVFYALPKNVVGLASMPTK